MTRNSLDKNHNVALVFVRFYKAFTDRDYTSIIISPKYCTHVSPSPTYGKFIVNITSPGLTLLCI